MEYVTNAKVFNIGKIAPIGCASETILQNISIRNECFLLLFMSDGTASFLFKTETGSTPMEYLRNYRIGVAKKHLAFY
jgi:methylphosphotriester-DNA--protein-cysteine methyltransferase